MARKLCLCKYFRPLGPDSFVFEGIGVDIKGVELAILPSIQETIFAYLAAQRGEVRKVQATFSQTSFCKAQIKKRLLSK